MARTRLLHPEFFKHDDLAKLSPLHRLLFQGLWTLADREGRLRDRPARLKLDTLPYDNCDVNFMLSDLVKHKFIVRYSVDEEDLIWIPSFLSWQKPHKNEQPSELPGFTGPEMLRNAEPIRIEAQPRQFHVQDDNGSCRAVSVSVSVSDPVSIIAKNEKKEQGSLSLANSGKISLVPRQAGKVARISKIEVEAENPEQPEQTAKERKSSAKKKESGTGNFPDQEPEYPSLEEQETFMAEYDREEAEKAIERQRAARMSSGEDALEAAKIRNARQKATNDAKKAARGKVPGGRSKKVKSPGAEWLQNLEALWFFEFKKAYPDQPVAAQFSGKERGQMLDVLKQFPNRDVVAAAIQYLIQNFEKIHMRFFKTIGTFPNVGFLDRHQDSLCQDAQLWARIAPILAEKAQWEKENPESWDLPEDLQKRYYKAQDDLKKLGLA